MTREEVEAIALGLPAATKVVQWGGADVYKVGGKVFAIGGWNDGDAGITFKVTDIAYELLKDRPGLRPAPYLASRGLSWIQHHGRPGLPDAELCDYIRHSYLMVAGSLSGKRRRELGLAETSPAAARRS